MDDDGPLYLVRGTLHGDRIVSGPFDWEEATDRCAELQREGYCKITVTHVQSGVARDLDEWLGRFGW
jgi:hypothetical protein